MEYQHIFFLKHEFINPPSDAEVHELLFLNRKMVFSYFVCNFFRKGALGYSRTEKSGP